MLAVLRHEADRVLSDQEPHLSDLSSWAAWNRWRTVLVARYRSQGTHCPLNALMGQIGTTPGAAEVTRALLTRWQQQLADGIASMQASGAIRADLSADDAAGALMAAIQGGVVIMWSTGSTFHLEAALDVHWEHLRGS